MDFIEPVGPITENVAMITRRSSSQELRHKEWKQSVKIWHQTQARVTLMGSSDDGCGVGVGVGVGVVETVVMIGPQISKDHTDSVIFN